jgi:hypothetical protein
LHNLQNHNKKDDTKYILLYGGFRVLMCTAKSTVARPNLFLEPRSQYHHNFNEMLTVPSKENYALNRTILLMHSNVSCLCRRPIAALWGVRSDENSYP